MPASSDRSILAAREHSLGGGSGMKVVSRKVTHPAPSATHHWHLLLAVAVVLAGCGGHGMHVTGGDAAQGGNSVPSGGKGGAGGTGGVGGVASGGNAGASRTGGAGVATGGVTPQAGSAGGRGTGGTGVATGGATSQGGSAGPAQDGGGDDGGTAAPSDAQCDLGAALRCPLRQRALRTHPAGPVGTVVFDSEGRVIEVIGLDGVSYQDPVYALAYDRFPCRAGQTILYGCGVCQ